MPIYVYGILWMPPNTSWADKKRMDHMRVALVARSSMIWEVQPPVIVLRPYPMYPR
jgi:hypothetical protein